MYIVVWVESAGESSVLTLKALAWIMQYFPTLIKVGTKTRDRKRKKTRRGKNERQEDVWKKEDDEKGKAGTEIRSKRG